MAAAAGSCTVIARAWRTRPGGRHCRKAMTMTKTSTFAIEAGVPYSRKVLSPPIEKAAHDRADQLPDAAEDDDHEGIDDVVGAERRADGAEQRQRAAGDAGQAGAEREGRRVDDAASARRGTPAISRFCMTARMRRPPVDLRQVRADAGDAERGQAEDEDAAVGQHEVVGDREAAAQPRRRDDLHVGRAEDAARRLLQHQADAPGR